MKRSTQEPLGDEMIGQTLLGRYRIVQRLGRGGMGVVYLASAKGAAGFIKPAVVKLILPGFVSNKKFTDMFIREAKILSNLKDPVIVDVLDFAEQDGLYVMVLEYVHGYQLRQWLQYLAWKGKRIPTGVCIQIVLSVCDALHYAHTLKSATGAPMQVIHRDISTPNILLDTDGHVKLVDFGVARISGIAKEYRTEQHTFKGNFPYTAPELFSGAEAGVQSDVYSCGVVLHEILTGGNFFSGKDYPETLWRVMNLEPSSIHGFREDAPDDIDTIIGKALAKSPADRYKTARDFAQALRALHLSTEREAVEMLRMQTQTDFCEEMAVVLELPSLQLLERAWRNPSLNPVSPDQRSELGDGSTTIISTHVSKTKVSAICEVDTVVVSPETIQQIANSDSQTLAIDSVLLIPAHQPGGETKSAESSDRPVQTQSQPSPTRSASRVTPWIIAIGATGLLAGGGAFFVIKNAKPETEPRRYLLVQSPVETPNTAVIASPAQQETLKQETPELPAKQPSAVTQVVVKETTPSKASGKKLRPANTGESELQLLTRAFRKRERDVEGCFERYAQQLDKKPELNVHFQVDSSGSVQSATLTPSNLAQTSLGKCVYAIATSTRFAPQKGTVSFRIPVTARVIKRGQ